MIAKIFFPAQIRRVIWQLSKDGALNKNAYQHLCRFYWQNTLWLLFFGAILVLMIGGYKYLPILIAAPFAIWLEGRKYIKQKFMPFIDGHKEILTYQGAWVSLINTKLLFINELGQTRVTPFVPKMLKKEEKKDIGDCVVCYVSSQNSKLCVPTFPRFMKMYCLIQPLLKESE